MMLMDFTYLFWAPLLSFSQKQPQISHQKDHNNQHITSK